MNISSKSDAKDSFRRSFMKSTSDLRILILVFLNLPFKSNLLWFVLPLQPNSRTNVGRPKKATAAAALEHS